jgi:hypothetical protein
MTQHPGKPIPSPALMEHIGTRFRRAVESYASSNMSNTKLAGHKARPDSEDIATCILHALR